MKELLSRFSTSHPWLVIGLSVLITGFFAYQFPKMKIDTDPENMLPADEPSRVFNAQVKEDFALSDFVAVGVVVEEGAFTPEILNRIYRIAAKIADIEGVIVEDILAPSMVDDIDQGDGGAIVIGTLMEEEVSSAQEAQHILTRIRQNPILRGKLASDDGKAIAIFVPIESKNMSHRIAGEIRAIVAQEGGEETYHIAGLPVAEDSFGAEMFVQMAISAPAAMLIIFLLMLAFFRQVRIVLAPIAVAMMSVIWAMGLLIYTGNTVHIMSSMIPIFLIPISVLDSIHIISEFHDRYREKREKKSALRQTISDLFSPMLFTSLTTVAGFLSLSLTPIPPVQVFGIFVAFGIAVAWILSMTLIPAIAMLIPDSALKNFGRPETRDSLLTRIMHGLRDFSRRSYRTIMIVAALVIVVAGFGLTLIEVNDNPVKWFKKSHPIRLADVAMNGHLAGTYFNYLVVEADEPDMMKDPRVLGYVESLQREIERNEIVGSTTALPDIVKKVRYELFEADSNKATIPATSDEIAQMLFVFEMSGGDSDDLYKFVSPEYDKANIWVQLKTGDNRDVKEVVDRTAKFISENPPPVNLKTSWAGLPYINIVWQEQMVGGMRRSLLWSYGVVFLMMVLLFRSIRWGLLSMLPLSITIIAIYGFIGYIGKPYDMPVAILSSLTLGLSIDFAIHFIQRIRMIFERTSDFDVAYKEIFESAGRAIGRNVLVIAIGFVPMLFSSLVPYITVGTFFLAIMITSGLATLILLPAFTQAFTKSLFREKKPV